MPQISAEEARTALRASSAPPTQEQLIAAAQRMADEDQQKLLERQKEIVAHLFDTGSKYTTVVVGAGFAGLFALWNGYRSGLPPILNYAVGISLALSLGSFVYYEVWKIFHTSLRTFQYGRAFSKPQREAVAEMVRIGVDERDKLPRIYTTWFFIFIFTVATSAVAAVILVGRMIGGLMLGV